ncbi:hypothetical protein ADUPG1_014682, partial [Aduncisulcus paluster]
MSSYDHMISSSSLH